MATAMKAEHFQNELIKVKEVFLMKHMNRLLALLMAAVLILSLAACSKSEADDPAGSDMTTERAGTEADPVEISSDTENGTALKGTK